MRIRRSEEHTSELQSQSNLVCRLLLEKKKIDKLPRLSDSDEYEYESNSVFTPVECLPQQSGRIQLKCINWLRPHFPTRFFFFNDTATTEIYTLSLHDALPI